MKFFKKKTTEELAQEEQKIKAEQKRIDEKIQAMKRSIEEFKGKLCEDFILGEKMSAAFKDSFKSHLEKQGLSATKRWCQGVAKKLAMLDEDNKKFSKDNAWVYNAKAPCGIKLQDKDKDALKAKNIVKFRKIFYNTTIFDNKFFGLPVKFTVSQKAAVNAVKKELNDLCNPDNFKPKAQEQ